MKLKNSIIKISILSGIFASTALLGMSSDQKALLRAFKLLGHIFTPVIQMRQSQSMYHDCLPLECVTGKHTHLFAKLLPLIFNK